MSARLGVQVLRLLKPRAFRPKSRSRSWLGGVAIRRRLPASAHMIQTCQGPLRDAEGTQTTSRTQKHFRKTAKLKKSIPSRYASHPVPSHLFRPEIFVFNPSARGLQLQSHRVQQVTRILIRELHLVEGRAHELSLNHRSDLL